MVKSKPTVDEYLKTLNGGRILDVATGTGSCIRLLMAHLKSYDSFTGIDTVFKAVETARKNFSGTNYKFVQMNADELAFRYEGFDTVSVCYSLHHFSSPLTVLLELKRAIKPGGHLLVFEMTRDVTSEPQRMHYLVHTFWAEIDRLYAVPHYETYSSKQLKSMMMKLDMSHMDVILQTEHQQSQDPFDPKIMTSILESIDQCLNKIKAHPMYATYKSKGISIRDQIEKNGFLPAPLLFFCAQK
ncbi:class I SAM-dependent methyltransferase [bacterium]|nr:class I SAM-dependent methyltransferase [candidate division CSSED10-310 bacterium]